MKLDWLPVLIHLVISLPAIYEPGAWRRLRLMSSCFPPESSTMTVPVAILTKAGGQDLWANGHSVSLDRFAP